MENKDVISIIKSRIESYNGFPKEGIVFRDIFSVLQDPPTFKLLIDSLKEKIVKLSSQVDVIVGLDARGFLFGSVLAYELGKPFAPVRKKGKLPGDVVAMKYQLEYGEDSIEVQKSSIGPGNKVVIVDDLLATGGTMKAATDLVTGLGAEVSLCLVCIELVDLEGRKRISDHPIDSIVTF